MRGIFSQGGNLPKIKEPVEGLLKMKGGFLKPISPFHRHDGLRISIEGFVTRDDGMPADSAFLADSFRKRGDRFTDDLDGQFLICIYDEKKDTVHISGDMYQATSLYYYDDGKIFVMGHTLKEVLEWLPVRPGIDMDSVAGFLQTGFSSSDRLMLRSVYRLLPGGTIRISEGKAAVSSRWDMSFQRNGFKDLEKHLDRYEKVFSQSISGMLDASGKGRLGCLLSGGHDTSMVFIQASIVYRRPIHTFTVSFGEWGFDESPKARMITEKFGGIHHRLLFKPEHLDLLPAMVNTMEEPTTSTSLPLYLCAKEASMHADILLTGDAGDTLWDEYYPVSEVHKYIRHMPAAFRQAGHTIVKALRDATDWERLWELEHVMSTFARKDMYDDFFWRFLSYRHYNDDQLSRLLRSGPKEGCKSRCSLKLDITKRGFDDDLIRAKMLYGVSMYLVPHAQKPAEAFGMRYYAPYLNRKVIRFINSLPRDWLNGGSTLRKLINDAEKRRFHKLALLRYLPKRYVYSLQQSFDVPYHTILLKRPDVLEGLLKRLKRRGWFDNAELDRLFSEYGRQRLKPHELFELKSHSYRIYTLLTLEVWCMQFLEGRIPGDGHEVPLEKYLEAWR